MNMKKRFTPIFILLCIIINAVFIATMVAAENETQSPEEIAQIQAANKEYERTHPKPKTPPPPLITTWMETSTDGKSLSIGTVHADNEMVVYEDKNTNTYHTGHCKYYEEKSGGDYSNPQWLANIVMDKTRCTLCIPDETYRIYREAVYRQKLAQQEHWINPMKNIIITLIIIYLFSVVAFIVYLIIRKKQLKIKTYRDTEKHIDFYDEEIEIEYSDFVKKVGVQKGVVYKFKCPKCGGVAKGIINTYNEHPHIHCTECGMTIRT